MITRDSNSLWPDTVWNPEASSDNAARTQDARRMLDAANVAQTPPAIHPIYQEVIDTIVYGSLTGREKSSNPKDAIGSTKLPLHLWPAEATAMGCLGMLEGREKYGRNNMIAGDGVIASIYIDAAKRHLDAWFAGEELTHDTGIPHLANALATIAIIVKCQAHGKMIDDRDYGAQPGGAAYRALVDRLTPYVKKVQTLFADKKPRHYTITDSPVTS